ncbi:MAG: hypothetical protein K0B09_00330 [Bacteroidales bacterium]|nr:hypothetical protein [Bacteroidales bacterium]
MKLKNFKKNEIKEEMAFGYSFSNFLKRNWCKFFLITLLLQFSCVINNSDKMYGKDMKFIEIKNQDLIKNIEHFYNENLSDAEFEFAVILDLSDWIDSNRMEIYYQMNLAELMNSLPNYYSRLDGKIVFIKGYSSEHDVEKSSSTESLFKEVFELQFDYFSSNGDYPPPITYSSPRWVFVGSELMSKDLR